MARLLLPDEERDLIADVFPEPVETCGPRRDPRTILDGILRVLRTGSPWRDVPEEFGAWKTCLRMFDQWNADGTLAEILHRLQSAFDSAGAVENPLWCIDGTTVRAARCEAGGGERGGRKSLVTTR